jgi:hypothetical protein
MDRRGLLLLAAALAAGVVLLLLGRPGGDDDQSGSEPPAATVPPAPPVAAPPAAEVPASEPPATSGASDDPPAPAVEPPDRESGVVGEETLDPAAADDAMAVAERFAAIWVGEEPANGEESISDSGWHDRLAGLATPALAASLAGADPPQPAREITGAGEVYFDDGPEWARIGVPAQRGTVVLDVVAVDGEWLVSAVDWWPA